MSVKRAILVQNAPHVYIYNISIYAITPTVCFFKWLRVSVVLYTFLKFWTTLLSGLVRHLPLTLFLGLVYDGLWLSFS